MTELFVMLREFRPRDAAPLMAHFREEFAEDAFLETDVDAMARLLRRSFGPFPRFLLATGRLFGRPIARFFVVEEDGGMVGTAFVSFLVRAGYVALVQVLPTYRRRGIATQLIQACEEAIREARRSYMILEVLDSNTAARALYDRLGFVELSRGEVLTREADGVRPVAPGATGVRPLARADGPALTEIARIRLSPEQAEVLPPEPDEFYVRPLVSQALASETMAWVALDQGRPAGFVRATVSSIMGAGHMTAPIVATALPPELDRALVDQAITWNFEHGARRVLCEVLAEDGSGRALLEGAGFRPAYGVRTLYRPVSA